MFTSIIRRGLAAPARRGRGRRYTALLTGALTLAAIASMPAAAHAWAFTNIVDFNLTESARTYGTYTISSTGDGSAYYRWADRPADTTVISGNGCADLALYGKADIGAGNTDYHRLFGGSRGLCFALRGRVASGAGSMYNYDGVLRR